METGFDIIFFWVARMIMMGLHFTGKVPFRTVYFHAMVRDEYGKKMSKTKGNVIDPMELVESVGADALRFTLAVLTAQGRDVKLSLEKVQGYREFVNKIWNAARFITMNLEGFSGKVGLDGLNLSSADKWALTRTGECLAKVKQALEDFKFNEAANALYQFVWHSFCDWYIEMAKGALAEGGERRSAAQNVLVFAFSALLRALHPFMPFVTEELWQRFKGYLDKAPEHIVVADFPSGSEFPRWDDEAQAMDEVFALVSAIRGVRSQAKVQPADMIRALVVPRDEKVLRHIHEHRADVERLARLQALEIVQTHERTEAEAVSVLPFGDVFVEIGEDRVNAVVSLLEKEMNEKQDALEVTRQRLSNPNFLAKAKEDVIEELREREKSLSEALERIKEGLRSFGRTV
jgi:valyl-tRNA synthetase